jgi:DNA-binding IclR family transcriptional regulator
VVLWLRRAPFWNTAGGVIYIAAMSRNINKLDGAQTIAKAALVLRSLSTFGSTGAALKDVCAVTALPKPTAHRILAALLAERLIERPAGTRDYRLGPELFAFGVTTAGIFDLKGLARESLERLAKETGDTIYLGMRCGFDGLCLDRVYGASAPEELILEVMDRWPLGIGSFSLAILSFLPDAEVADIVEYNRRRLREGDLAIFERIEKTILKTRRNGYAFRSMRSRKGLAGVAVPIIDGKLRPVASLCATAGAQRMTGAHLESVVRRLQREASVIARKYEVGCLRREQHETWRAALKPEAPGRLPE